MNSTKTTHSIRVIHVVRDSEGWNILFYAYKQRMFPSVIRKKLFSKQNLFIQ